MLRRPVHASLVCGEKEKREGRTEVGLHMYFVRLFVIFGAFATCSSVHPSRNWLQKYKRLRRHSYPIPRM